MSKSNKRKILVISGINLFEGGPLSIIQDCLNYLNNSHYINTYRIIALVHDKRLYKYFNLNNIELKEVPQSRTSYFHRLYFEYIYFKKFAKENKVDFWLSLHDITPYLLNVKQAVYCHNPSPFNRFNLKDILIQPTQILFRLFYKYLYRINIKKNKYIIVQQLWIKEKFRRMFGIGANKIIVAKPNIQEISMESLTKSIDNKEKIFFFPTFPRPFKNIELICNAVKILNLHGVTDFKVVITIDGTENKYARYICTKYRNQTNLQFIGLLTREGIYELYAETDCLIFPSKLETWGLPISEFKQFKKTIFAADLPYARETVGDYDKVKFFKPTDAKQLASYMAEFIKKEVINYDPTESIIYSDPFAKDWNELFSILLN